MKEIYINADDYNTDSIKTIQGNNNAEVYKLYLQYDNEKIDLTGKTVNLAFLRVGSTDGDIIENLNVTNAKEGEITLKITNKLTKKNGTYSCQLAILGEGDFLEHTATFTLTVENNIFSDITKAIADSKDFTYLENILDKASKLSEKLKENTSSATNANSNLESNITEANNINSKLLENTSTATGLNKNLESNITLAEGVKETIKDLDIKNTEATEKIEALTGLNSKAEELSNNINEALPVKDALVKNIESAKVANTNLLTTNQEAVSKNTELQASLEKTKEFINGLDGSQNIPQIRLDVDALQNGLKSNQALSYEGSSISANDTLEGRTEGMRIGGRTLVNLVNIRKMILSKETTFEDDIIKFRKTGSDITYLQIPFLSKPNTKYTVMYTIVKNTVEQPDSENYILYPDGVFGDFNSTMNTFPQNGRTGLNKFCLNTKSTLFGKFSLGFHRVNIGAEIWIKNLMILEGDWTNKEIPDFFEGIKSFGEEEKVEDKYKISILSNGKNLFDKSKCVKGWIATNGSITGTNDDSFTSDFIPVKPDTQYSKSAREVVGYYDINKILILRQSESTTFTTPVNTKYIRVVGSPYQSKEQFQVEEGSQITSYQPYQSNKKDILIKEPLKDDDVLYEDNEQVKVYRPTKQYTFTGDENFQKINVYGDVVRIDFACDDIKPSGYIISNNFAKGIIGKENLECINIHANSKYVQFQIKLNKLTSPDVEGFKAWLKANPTTIAYQLAEPTVEIVENCVDIDLDTFGEKTYFNILNSLPGTLDFKVPSNLGSVVQNMAKEVNNIWDVINNLLVPSILDVNKKVALATIKNNLK